MSIQVVAWVLEESSAEHGSRLVLLSLANHADRDGTRAFPAIETIAHEARMSRRAAQYGLRRLEEEGRIERTGMTRTGTNVYRILMDFERGGADIAGVQNHVETTTEIAPEPSREPSSLSGARTPERVKPVTYRSKRVPVAIVDEATRLLAVFCEATGCRLRARDGTGGASDALKQIIGSLRSRPEVTPAEWEGAIRNTVAYPPGWIEDGKVEQLGQVFGRRAIEWALANNGTAAEVVRQRHAGDPARRERSDKFMAALRSFGVGGG